MAREKRSDPLKTFAPRYLPWLLAAAAFAVYWLTLDRWVSQFNLGTVVQVSGWDWHPQFLNPLLFLVTVPFRSLPVAQIPFALNLFSAVCAALTLGLLARSVAILPQDRTDAQRERERSDFSFLTIWSAWLPPVLAVAVCGLQLTFWEQATNCTGEMFDLLLFAFIVWSLLEYRLDERECQLFLAAFAYGVGMAENWAMIGFFPLFFAAIIWTRKLNFFNLRFLGRMLSCGLAGLLFYFLLPALIASSHKVPVTFWQALKSSLIAQFFMPKLFFTRPDFRQTVELLSLTSLLPLLLLSIRWKSSFGDSSKLGLALTSFMFHVVHAVIFGVCLWVAFDPPFSPRHLGFGLTFLSFYYLAALGIGYFCGYFLLVFGKQATSSRSQKVKPSPFDFLNIPVTCGVWLFAVLAVAGLVYKNAPQIRETNGDTLKRYAALVEENLPRTGGILLSDDPSRLFIMQSALARDGRAKDFVPLDTHSLVYPAYQRFLHREFPKQWPELVSPTQVNGLNPLGLIGALAMLSKSNALYYLHPSDGYYFEQFYLEPHGLVYKLKTLPNDTLLPPRLDKNQIAENEDFWARAEKTALAPIEKALAPTDPNAPQSLVEMVFAQLHIEPVESGMNSVDAAAGSFYSRCLNFWGVQLQRAGDLTNAAAHFETALKLNPGNAVAQINLLFNQNLQAGRNDDVKLPKSVSDEIDKYFSWNEMLNDDGPFDEPGFCFETGAALVSQNGFFRQAVAPLERVRELVPENLNTRILLAQIYITDHLPDRALIALREPLANPEKFSLVKSNETQLNVLAAAAYFQQNNSARAAELLETEIFSHPNDDDLLTATTRAFMAHGLFTNALEVIDNKLKLTPDDPGWIFGRGYVSMQLKNYDDAIAAMSRVLATQTNNNDARFNRAVAYLETDRLDDARADYQKLQQSFTNSFQIAYGLGEIAWRKHETNEAVRNFEIYLANVNTNTDEARTVIERLRELKK